MRRFHLLAGAALALGAAPAAADTLRDALVKAYNSNPTITGARAQQRANDENVPIARAAGLPTLTVQGDYSENFVKDVHSFTTPDRQVTAQAQFSVPLYSGGAVKNGVAAAKRRVESGIDQLRGTESDLFTNVVTAYMDVIRDEAIVGLNTQNVHVLDVNLQASKDRFQVGDLTRTDVAQSEARLALAQSQLQSSQARLIGSRESYIRLVGTPPETLEDPPALPNLPDGPEAAVDVAIQNNPTLLAAKKASDAAALDVKVANAQRLPRINATVTGTHYNYLGSLPLTGAFFGQGDSGRTVAAGVGITIPLYQGGRPAAQIRQAKDTESQSIERITEVERAVVDNARSAYAAWQSSLEVIKSSQVAVNADKLSLEGVRAENSVGNRTILDILNAEQELLNSQVNLVTAQHDAYVAGFTLLAAMGEAEARDLGLDGGALYDPLVHYRSVRHRILDEGTGPDPRPIATSTSATPAQGPELTRPLDPILDTPPVDTGAPLTAGENTPNR